MVSIHAFRGEGDAAAHIPFASHLVSIHAFRGEGDHRSGAVYSSRDCFNPRLPGGRRHSVIASSACCALFQSTPSGGKATQRDARISVVYNMFQSTPSGGKATGMRFQPQTVAGRFNPRLPGGKATPSNWSFAGA